MCAGLEHSVGALMSHRGGRTHGHGCWETGNKICVTAESIFQVQTHRGGTGGLCNGDVSNSRKHPGDSDIPSPFLLGKRSRSPALSCAL